MRNWIVLCLLMFVVPLMAQNTLAVDADSLAVELQFDSIPVFEFFNPDLVEGKKNRVAAVQPKDSRQGWYFLFLITFSILITWIYLNSKELVRSSLKAISSIKDTVQFSRSDRQSNVFYFILYALLFLSGLSLILYFIGDEILGKEWQEWQLVAVVFGVFILDYLFSFLYIFFTSNSRTVDLVQSVVLNYAVVLGLIIWPALFFIVLASLSVAKVFAVILFVMIGFILLVKEIRVLQVIWMEKIQVFSIHFFAYLCTFKFLPILVLIKIILF